MLFPGVFSFPWYRSVWPYWLLLWVLALPPIVLFAAAIGDLVPLGLLLPLALIQAVLWYLGASAVFLTILRDTAAGNDEIYDWPSAHWLDWIADAFYLLESLVVCAVADLGLAWLLSADLPGKAFLMLGCPAVLFPLTLLTMLENESPLLPVSLPVWRTLITRPGAWALFYLESLVLLVATGVVATVTEIAGEPRGVVGFPFDGGFWWAISIGPLVLVAVLLIYFRLLGRLAWYCGQEPPDSAADEFESGDEDAGE